MAIVDMTRESMFDRMKRAAMLDVSVYESVEADRSATGQAAAVVAMVAVAQAIGSEAKAYKVIGLLLAALLGWVVWSGVARRSTSAQLRRS